jgi:8-oxo-dGTP pyrophosphatase MutT (NUDIX family)
MYVKIYFGDKPLFLCDQLDEQINVYVHHDDAIFIDEFSPAAVNSMIHEMRKEKVHAGVFYHPKLEALKKAFWKKFSIVPAAGGWVQNKDGEVLFIFRRGKWDLPKGKLEKGESLEQCAVREVKEETGIQELKLEKFLMHSYHTYDENGKHFLKESSWFGMYAGQKQSLIPQLEEQITALKWVKNQEIREIVRSTYPSIRDIAAVAAISGQ